MSISGIRVSKRQLPSTATLCLIRRTCVYRDCSGLCDDPQINKGNSDAGCFHMNNKDVLTLLSDGRQRDP